MSQATTIRMYPGSLDRQARSFMIWTRLSGSLGFSSATIFARSHGANVAMDARQISVHPCGVMDEYLFRTALKPDGYAQFQYGSTDELLQER